MKKALSMLLALLMLLSGFAALAESDELALPTDEIESMPVDETVDETELELWTDDMASAEPNEPAIMASELPEQGVLAASANNLIDSVETKLLDSGESARRR